MALLINPKSLLFGACSHFMDAPKRRVNGERHAPKQNTLQNFWSVAPEYQHSYSISPPLSYVPPNGHIRYNNNTYVEPHSFCVPTPTYVQHTLCAHQKASMALPVPTVATFLTNSDRLFLNVIFLSARSRDRFESV